MTNVDEQLQPAEYGTVRMDGQYSQISTLLLEMAEDIERHGEVHANFKDVDGEVECRLGTTVILPYGVKVFDGDQWHPFTEMQLIGWDVPMEVYH